MRLVSIVFRIVGRHTFHFLQHDHVLNLISPSSKIFVVLVDVTQSRVLHFVFVSPIFTRHSRRPSGTHCLRKGCLRSENRSEVSEARNFLQYWIRWVWIERFTNRIKYNQMVRFNPVCICSCTHFHGIFGSFLQETYERWAVKELEVEFHKISSVMKFTRMG